MAVNKVEANGETLIDLTGDTVTAGTLLAGRTAHQASGERVIGTFDAAGMQEQIDYNTNNGVKNLLKITAESRTINGVTFTVDKEAGTITANGTADQLTFFAFKMQINDGKYILSGCPPTGSDSTYRLDIRNGEGGITFTNAVDYGMESSTTTLSGDKYLNIRIVSGYTCSNLVFKPMIRSATITDKTFEPYAEPNYQLTNKINSLVELVVRTPQNHNGIYRGKDLTNIYTVDEMYNMVHSGNFDDLFLGDYFTKSITTDIYTKFTGTAFESGVTYYERSGADLLNWTYTETEDAAYDSSKTYYTKLTKTENVDLMIAAFDYYYNAGDTAPTSHHLVLIPRNYGFKTTAKMNSTNTTTGSYYNCEMHQTTLPCYAKSLKTALNNHLLSHGTILPNAINASTPSMAGAGFTGASTNWAWYTTELQLMSEQQVYGTRAWTSSAYDIGLDYRILPVFNFINPVLFGRTTCWLRSVVSSTLFALCGNSGYATNAGASYAHYVRPLILFG